ncbi:serine hydrolase domain-containing protein [Lysinibacillus cavernae]|uniref:serine hydrolase domain-containing protein n=1 Tax=Lysinibacillus cavernae TaxID=2666135 RepID=UPI0012D8D1A3|nr:serine hydrolase domain-containing protein [Lysinibacillus cavernae]
MVDEYLNELVREQEIPGAVLIVQQQQRRIVSRSYGAYIAEDGSKQAIVSNTLFDLASLTKVVATLPAILLLMSRNQISVIEPVQTYLPEFKYAGITIQHLLQHCSGLPADLTPTVKRHHKRDIMQEVLASEVVCQPNEQVLYSDLGMILVGKVIEKVTGKSLKSFVEQEIFKPWGMHQTCFQLPEHKRGLAASTEMVAGNFVQGVVHDEKALLLEGVAGSAGLFSCAEDLAKYAEIWLGIRKPTVMPYEWMELAYTKTFRNRGLGFEVWEGDYSSFCFGRGWTKGSFGHTGFTGTSIWMDPVQKAFVILLTNAVHYGRNSNMRSIREKLHTMIYKKLLI